MNAELIRTIESVDAGDWQLTNLVLRALGWKHGVGPEMISPAGDRHMIHKAPPIAEDDGVALSLIPTSFDYEIEVTREAIEAEPEPGDGGFVRLDVAATLETTRAVCRLGDPRLRLEGEASTLPLAICAAILRLVNHNAGDASVIPNPKGT